MCRMRAQPEMCETVRQAGDRRVETGGPSIFSQYGLMVLTSACDQRSHSRCAYALSHVPHEVHQARRSVAFFFRKANVPGSRERHEQKPDRQVAHNTNPHSGPKTYKQIKPFARDIHPESQCNPTKREQITCLKPRKESANQRQNE